MKINVNQVPQEGLYLEEELSSTELDLETDLIKFRSALKLKGHLTRITNAITVELNIRAVMFSNCARCLEEFDWEFNKDVKLSFSLEARDIFIDLSDAIREEVILDYPIKLLCRLNCKGLCVKCGKNKNEGGCNCGST